MVGYQGRLLHSPVWRGNSGAGRNGSLRNRRNKARMSVETKSEVKSPGLGLPQTVFLNVCEAPKAQLVPFASTCPFGILQNPQIAVCAKLEGVAES